MRTLLKILTDATRLLAGQGATVNAGHEVDRVSLLAMELDAQLARIGGPPPRRAA
ncbi:MAG: hypothetical protein ACYDD4_06430 [Acidimicrobiales bacterium]